MKPIEKTANDLFQILRTRFSPLNVGDENAEVTVDPAQARFFSFMYKEGDEELGPVSISIVNNRGLKVYYSNDMVENMQNTQEWYALLKELRYFAKQNLLSFDARNIQKDQLDTRDFNFLKVNDGPYQEKDVEITESAMFGTKRKSMQRFENATLIVNHKKSVDETVRGSRSRYIESIFIENNGERFRFPVNYLNGARAMAVHVSEGGTPYDAIGQHIISTVTEMQNLAKFARMTKHHAMEDVDAADIRNRVVEAYNSIKKDIMRMQNVNNYRSFAETFTPAEASGEADVTTLQEKFTRKVWNEKMNELLPSVQRALETKVSEAEQGIKVGDTVKPTKGPHKGHPHEVIHDFGDGHYNVKPKGLSSKQIRYSLGAARAHHSDLLKETEVNEASPSVEKSIKNPNFVLVLKKDDAADSMIRRTKFTRADGLLSFIMSDIASRIIGNEADAVANFASEMAINIGDEGASFGTKMTPEYKRDKQLAMLLAKKYLDDLKMISTDPEYANTVRKDPKDVYGAKKVRGGGYHEAVDSFESWANDVVEATTTGTTGTTGTGMPKVGTTNPTVVKALSGGDANKAREIKRVSDKLAKGQRLSPQEQPIAGEIAKSVMTTKKPTAAMQALAQDEYTDMDENPVKDAIIHRLSVRYGMADLLKKYGLDRVEAAIDDVAGFHDDVEELGSSDISIMVKQVLDNLAATEESVVVEKTLKVKAERDFDGDGEIESPEEEYMGSRDRAIKKASKPMEDQDSELIKESLALLKLYAGL